MKYILASTSPRRQQLLKKLQLTFDILPPNVDESSIFSDGNPENFCIKLAKLKASDISQHYPNELVIGADTIVVIGEEILGKPTSKKIAIKMLEKLSGNIHQVYTGVCLKSENNKIDHTFAEITSVRFHNLNQQDILHYIEKYQPYDKAGSYGIQDWSTTFIKEIKGCYDNVVGFPLSRFYQELKKLNINLLDTN
tara:strand:+ start:66 stop:650 length:585 start_codon:yes stop_codon:yes gene_type:complete